MLTISQLAAHAGVTVAAVRHYHKIGLLPEPERDRSGYRTYDAQAVVRLIRIHVLAGAGVPLARVDDLLDAEPDAFARGIQEIDAGLRTEIRRLRETRSRLARLAAGEHLALPEGVVGYLDRLRDLGVSEAYLERERDAWIMVSAQLPEQIDDIIVAKHADLDDPDTVHLYSLLSSALDWTPEDPRVVETADVLDRIFTRAASGHAELEDPRDAIDEGFVALLDATMAGSAPAAERLLRLLEDRGWHGWTRPARTGSPA